jgi:hypothetical protein
MAGPVTAAGPEMEFIHISASAASHRPTNEPRQRGIP